MSLKRVSIVLLAVFVLAPRPLWADNCAGDTNDDQVVDVVDMLAIITSWGQCSAPCAGDTNTDGVVDITDLVSVISAWGACPPSVLDLDLWTFVQIDDARDAQYFGLALADLTGDGYVDIASGKYFYRNPGDDLTAAWSRSVFPADVDALLAVDVDDDAYGDLIAMDADGLVYWLEALDEDGGAWSSMTIGDVGTADHGISSQGYSLGQLVAGGKPEVIINVGNIFYLEIPDRPDSVEWPMTLIASTLESEGIAVADIDGDGDMDVCGTTDELQIAWWENPSSGAPEWAQHEIGSAPSETADRFAIAQLDDQAGPDIVVSVANGDANGVYWFQAPDDPVAGNWSM
ncbi:MAG: hypothetical protein ACYTGR_15190, partial [Planctomycetota bacterium]